MPPTPIMAMAILLLGAFCPRTWEGTMLKAVAATVAALLRRKVLRERFMRGLQSLFGERLARTLALQSFSKG